MTKVEVVACNIRMNATPSVNSVFTFCRARVDLGDGNRSLRAPFDFDVWSPLLGWL